MGENCDGGYIIFHYLTVRSQCVRWKFHCYTVCVWLSYVTNLSEIYLTVERLRYFCPNSLEHLKFTKNSSLPLTQKTDTVGIEFMSQCYHITRYVTDQIYTPKRYNVIRYLHVNSSRSIINQRILNALMNQLNFLKILNSIHFNDEVLFFLCIFSIKPFLYILFYHTSWIY